MTTQEEKLTIKMTLRDEAARFVQGKALLGNTSVNKIIKRALSTQKFVDQELATGSTFLVRKADGSTSKITFSFQDEGDY